MPRNLLSSSGPNFGLVSYSGNRKIRKPVGSGLKSAVLSRSRGKCELCHKDVIGLGLKPRYHHKDGNPSHNAPSNIVLLCNDCHDKVHVYKTKTSFHPIYGRVSKKVLIAKRIKKGGRKKKTSRKKRVKRKSEFSGFGGLFAGPPPKRRNQGSFGFI